MIHHRRMHTPISTRWASGKLPWLLLVAALTQLTAATVGAQEPDPVPIQRIEIPPERLPAEMERVRRNVLTEMPRTQFEDLVQRAARAEAAGKSPPRLAEASYRATFSDSGLVGTAQWRITHDVDSPGRLPLSTMQLALRSAHWSDHSPVVLGQLENRPNAGVELLVEGKGERTLALEWSARGLPEPGAQRFELRLPVCAVTTFDLDLPADHSPQVDRDEVVLSGPIGADKPGFRRWRLAFPRSTGAGLTVRLTVLSPRAPTQPPPLLRTLIQTTQKLMPGQIESEYQIDVQAQRGGVRQLSLDLAPELRVLDVQAPDMEGWNNVASASGNRIEVRWNEPFRGGRLTLRALASLPPLSQIWTSPGIQVVGALSRGEKLALVVHPDLELEAWSSGGFQFVAGPAMSGSMRVMSLESRNVGPGASKRPESHVRVVAGRFQTRETWVWRLDSQQSTLSVDLRIAARQSPISLSTWQIPVGWEVEQVESVLPNSDLRWNVSPVSGGRPALLSIDLGRQPLSIASGSERHLTVRLRGSGVSWTSSADGPSATLSVPQFRPESNVSREGTLSVRLSPALAQITSGGRSLRADQTVPFRGAPDGEIQVRPRRGRLQARCDLDLVIGNLPRATYKLQLTPTTSASEEVLLYVSAPVVFDSWRTSKGGIEVRALEPLLSRSASEAIWPFAPAQTWDFLGRWAVARVAAGSWWKLTLDRRLQGPTMIELTARLTDGADRTDAPLLAVVGADSFEGRAVVRFAPGEALQFQTTGISSDAVPDELDGWARRAFVYRAPPFALTFKPTRQDPPVNSARVDQAILITKPTGDGPTLHRFRFRLGGWQARELPITMPADVEIVSIQVNGAVVTGSNLLGAQNSLTLPWNPAHRVSIVDIVYAVPASPSSSFGRLEAIQPVLPVAMELQRIWRLPPGVVPVSFDNLSSAESLEISRQAPVGWADGPGADWIQPSTNSGAMRAEIWVARKWALLIVGFAASLIPLLLSAFACRGRRFAAAIELMLVGLGLIWLPSYLWWSLLAALTISLVLIAADFVKLIRRRIAEQTANAESIRTGAAVASLVMIMIVAIRGIAGPTDTAPVYLIPGATPGVHTALVPPDLIETLRAMSRQGEPTATVVLQSRYDGEVVDSWVRWSARFDVFRHADGSGPMTIGLPEAQLLSAEIDRRPVLPRVNDEAGRFTFDLNGRGIHSIVLKFQTPIAGDVERDTRFTIPDAPINSCSLQLPASASDFQVVGARGVQQNGSDKDRPRLQADLGRIGNVHVHWRQPSAGTSSHPTVQAAHLWEISESSERLQSVFRFRFGSTGPKSLEIDVPPELELAEVSPRQVDEPAGLSGPIALREWRHAEVSGTHRHHLEFQSPLAGLVQLELELVPRQTPGGKPVLSFPELAGDFDCAVTAAVRLQELRAQVIDAKGWERIGPEEFLHAIWQPLRVDVVDREPDLAFRRRQTPTPSLQLDLRLPEAKAIGEQQINWRVGPGRAQLQATAQWSDLPAGGLVEWDVPAAIAINGVYGDGLRHWSRAGSRLQVWLESRASDRSVSLSLTGEMPRVADEATQERTPFVAPVMRQVGVGRQSTQLTVQANEGWRLEAEANVSFHVYPTTDLPGVTWSGYSESPAAATFSLRQAQANVHGDILTLIETSNRSFPWSAAIDLQLAGDARTGKIQTIVVEATRVDGERPRISLPPGMRLRDTRLGVRRTSWVVDGLPGRHLLTLSGRLTTGQSQMVEAPHVSVRSAADTVSGVRRWLAVAAGVQVRDLTGLQLAVIPTGLDPRPESERAGTTGWALPTEVWSLRIDESTNRPRDAIEAATASDFEPPSPNDAGNYLDHEQTGKSDVGTVASRQNKALESLALVVVLAAGLMAIARFDRVRANASKAKAGPAQH